MNGLGNYECPKGYVCGNPEQFEWYNDENEHLEDRSEFNYGITTFDNLGKAFLSVFQIITSDTWYL
jgi:hypothetical protein